MAANRRTTPARGRRRSDAAGSAILTAAWDLVVRHGYTEVTTEMIAKAAGTGKQTIYRRWPSKAELVLDAFAAYAAQQVDGYRSAAPIEKALSEFLARLCAAVAETTRVARGLMAYAQEDQAFRTQLFERFIRPRRQALLEMLARAVRAGELPPDADLHTAVTTIYGATWYRLLLDEALDSDFAGQLAAFAIAGLHDRAERNVQACESRDQPRG